MKSNKIMLIIGMIFVIVVIIVVIVTGSNKSKISLKNENTSLIVYKSVKDSSSKTGYLYQKCNISSKDISVIIQEFNKIYNNASTTKILKGEKINGFYKVEYEDKYLAFDNYTDNKVYLGSANSIFSFDSPIYEKVIKNCQ